jgi:heme exporter protein A
VTTALPPSGPLACLGMACTLGTRRLFSDLDFTVESGQWLMLTGDNGSGKSTLLRIIAGLIRPDAGAVHWQGAARQPGDPAWHAAMLYQGHATGWKEQLTARENLLQQAWLDLGPDADHPAGVQAALDRVGLGRQRDLPFMRLSAGQRRRVGLARLAFSQRPLWLLDEPNTALDTAGQALFADLLDTHLAGGGCAVVATHLEVPSQRDARVLRLQAPVRPRPAALLA